MELLTNTQRCLNLEANFPMVGSPEEQLEFLVNYAILSPSVRESQPWNFKVQPDRVELHLDDSRSRRASDPDTRELVISCGAALQHLIVAANRFGIQLEIEALPDGFPGVLAVAKPAGRKAASELDVILFYAIHKWLNVPHAYRTNRKVPPDLLTELTRMTNDTSTWIHFSKEPTARDTLAGFVVEGDLRQKKDREESRKTVSSDQPKRRRGDGMLMESAGHVASYISSFLKRPFSSPTHKRLTRQLSEDAPILAVLGTAADTPADWLAAGRMLAAILLRSLAVGVRASLLNQPVEVPEIRARLSAELGLTGHPQVVFRLGIPSSGSEQKSTKNGEIAEQYL